MKWNGGEKEKWEQEYVIIGQYWNMFGSTGWNVLIIFSRIHYQFEDMCMYKPAYLLPQPMHERSCNTGILVLKPQGTHSQKKQQKKKKRHL